MAKNLNEYMQEEINRIASLFKEKQNQYGKVDELNNFRLGALLLDGKVDLDSEFESAKAYMAKHIAFLYSKNNGNITDSKIEESLGDIIVYCHIMRYMIEKNKLEESERVAKQITVNPNLVAVLDYGVKHNS